MMELTTPVQYVKGIGPRVAEVLAGKGISTVEDLLYYLPFRYEDRLNPRGLGELRPGEMATVIAEVRGSGLFRTRRAGKDIFQMTAGQGRSKLTCLWFHGRYLMGKFQPGQLVALYGKVEENTWGRGGLQIIQPQFEILGENGEGEAADRAAQSLEVGRIVPIYESAANGKLTSRWFRRIIHSVLENLPEVAESIPAPICERMALIPRRQAFWQAHWPEAGESLAKLQAARTPGHRRLIFEELFFLELGLELKRRKQRTHPGISFELNDRVRQAIKPSFPFTPRRHRRRC